MIIGIVIEDSYRFTNEKLESVSCILLISVKVLEVLFQKYKSNINGKGLKIKSLSFWIQVCHPHLQISLFKWLNHILKMVSMLRFCHFYKKTLNFTFVISIQNDALCYSECCTDFINCCVSSIQSYSTSKCVDQSDKSALFWIEVRFSKWRYIFLTNENKWGILCFALIWLFSVNLNECSIQKVK